MFFVHQSDSDLDFNQVPSQWELTRLVSLVDLASTAYIRPVTTQSFLASGWTVTILPDTPCRGNMPLWQTKGNMPAKSVQVRLLLS